MIIDIPTHLGRLMYKDRKMAPTGLLRFMDKKLKGG